MGNVVDLRPRAAFAPSVEFDCSDDEAPAFVRGVECGILTARLDARPETWEGTYHTSNMEMLRRIAAANGYAVEIVGSDDPTWVFADFVRVRR